VSKNVTLDVAKYLENSNITYKQRLCSN